MDANESFANMTYSGLSYQTRLGVYKVKGTSSLSYLGRHTFPQPPRDEFTTYVDHGIREAWEQYPGNKDWNDFENFSRSYYSLAGHMKSLNNFNSHTRTSEPTDQAWLDTKAHCFALFSTFPRITSMDFDTELFNVPFEPTSAAGIGIPGKKGDDGNLLRAVKQANATIHTCISKGIQHVIDNSTPDRAFVRTQLADLTKRTKIRHVFGQAFQYILLEGLVAAPLLEMFMMVDSPYFLGNDPRIQVPNFIESLRNQGLDMFSIDWSDFDSKVEHWEASNFFDLVESITDFPSTNSRLAWEFTRVFFINRKIAAPDGTLHLKARGVPSGSYYTNVSDSWVNYMRIQYLHRRVTGTFIEPQNISVLGDDGAFGVKPHFNMNPYTFSTAIPQHMRNIWILSPDKMTYGRSSDLIEYLQRTIVFGDQHRDNKRVERLSMFTEYPQLDRQISSYRARALWEDGNYESAFLAFATKYLEMRYGVPPEEKVPRWVKQWIEKIRLPVMEEVQPLYNSRKRDSVML